jgi:hypothetical protein
MGGCPSARTVEDMTTLHVEPSNGSWVVRREGAVAPLSQHAEAGAAARAARAQAEASGGTRVVIRDRYHRTHAFEEFLQPRAVRAPLIV